MAAVPIEYTEKTAPRVALDPALLRHNSLLANHLFVQGWVTIPLVALGDIATKRNQILDVVTQAPEFVDDLPISHKFSLTGFAALPYASSFHNYAVRILREDAYAVAKPVLRDLAKLAGFPTHMDQYVDRLMVRQGRWPEQTPQAATAEAWHRDESVDAHGAPMPDSDTILGGWINLNSTDESLLCAPTTHFSDRNRGTGFGAIRDPAERRRLSTLLRRVVIPPGHLLMFYENTAHMVASAAPPARTTQIRLFTGFRLTNSLVPATPTVVSELRGMEVMALKSGQIPPTYSRLNWVNFPAALETWTLNTMQPSLMEDRTVATGLKKGTTFIIPFGGPMSRHTLPGLRDADSATYQPSDWVKAVHGDAFTGELDLYYPAYSDDELQFYTPQPLDRNFGVVPDDELFFPAPLKRVRAEARMTSMITAALQLSIGDTDMAAQWVFDLTG